MVELAEPGAAGTDWGVMEAAGAMSSVGHPQHWLFVSARVFTRRIRGYFFEGGDLEWSAPAKLLRGDLVLVYEMGKPDSAGDAPGRKQIGWVMQAISDAREDDEDYWDWVADFRGMPIIHPLPLAEAKRDRAFRDWRGGSLQGSGGHLSMPDAVWDHVMKRLDERNPGVAARLAGPGDVSFARVPVDPVEEVEDDVTERRWRRERLLQDEVADLVEDEGWASRPDAPSLLLSEPTEHGYHLPATGWYVDDLLLLGPRHLLVVEYELHASGGDQDGAQQADDYASELRKRLWGWTVDGLVIAESFNEVEYDAAQRLNIECLQAALDSRGQVQLHQVGTVRGPVAAAREGAMRTRRRR
jgi:hypothetical protein